MSRNSENNNDSISRTKKKQQEVDAKENDIEDAIENASDKIVKESKKEANIIGDSDHEQIHVFIVIVIIIISNTCIELKKINSLLANTLTGRI